MQKDPYRLLLDYSFWLLGRKAYSEAEVRRKLKLRAKRAKLESADEAIAKVMARLLELKYIDDDKILENYFEYRLKAKPQGKYAFLVGMKRKGISVDRARAEWERRGVNEEEMARDLLSSKRRFFRSSKMAPAVKKKKIAALLASRGFAPDTIWGILDKV